MKLNYFDRWQIYILSNLNQLQYAQRFPITHWNWGASLVKGKIGRIAFIAKKAGLSGWRKDEKLYPCDVHSS